jgi:hypothetical protein
VLEKDATHISVDASAVWEAGNNYGMLVADLPFKDGSAQYVGPMGADGKACTVTFGFPEQGSLVVTVDNLAECGKEPTLWGANVDMSGKYFPMDE